MADANNKKDNNYIFASDENLEQQAALMEEMADDVLARLELGYKTLSQKISENQRREYSKYEAALAKAEKRQKEYEAESSNWRESLAANLLNKTGPGQTFNTSFKSTMLNVGKEIVAGFERALQTYLFQPIKDGFTEMSSAYEQNFTEISGRMRTNRSDTYDVMKGAVDALMNSPAYNAIDANRELIPELRKVSGQGFTGSQAIEQALSNSIDSHIMPWLDTANATWANLSFNLNKSQMEQIKGQQLLLQANQQGNRLLQSGVINELTQEIAPTLTNIEFLNGGASSLAPEAQAYMVSLMDKGMSEQEAYAEAKDVLRIWKDPTSALTSDNAYDVLRGQAAYQGGDYSDIVNAGIPIVSLAASTGNNAGFVMHEMGMNPASGIYRAETAKQQLSAIGDTDWDEFKGQNNGFLYQQAVNNVAQQSTATASWDTAIRNQTTETTYFLNKIAHGSDTAQNILEVVGNILKLLAGYAAGKTIMGLFGGGDNGGILSKIGSKFLGGGKSGGGITSKIGSKLASGGSKVAGAVGSKLAAGGSAMSGGALSGTGAAALGAGTVLAGGALMAGGIGTIVNTYQNRDEPSTSTQGKDTDNKVGYATGAAATLGGAAAITGVLAGSGPIGWVGLAVGAAALATKKIYDEVTYIGGMAEQTQKEYQQRKTALIQEFDSQYSDLSDIADGLSNAVEGSTELEQQRQALIQSGIMTEEDIEKARNANKEGLQALTDKYLEATDKFSEGAGDILDKYMSEDKAKTTDAQNQMLDFLQTVNDGDYDENSDEFKAAERILKTYYEDLQNQVASGESEQWDKYNQKTYENLTKALEDGSLTEKEMNQIVDEGWRNQYLTKLKLSQEGKTKAYNTYARLTGIEEDDRLTFHDIDEVQQVDKYVTIAQNTEDKNQAVDALEALKAQGITSKDYSEIGDVAKKWGLSGYATGTSFIKETGLALLHKGEAIINARDNAERLLSLSNIVELGNSLLQKLNFLRNDRTSNTENTDTTQQVSNSSLLTTDQMNSIIDKGISAQLDTNQMNAVIDRGFGLQTGSQLIDLMKGGSLKEIVQAGAQLKSMTETGKNNITQVLTGITDSYKNLLNDIIQPIINVTNNNEQSEPTNTDNGAKETSSAIQSQTNVLQNLLQTIVNLLAGNAFSMRMPTSNSAADNKLVQMMPLVANTRNLGTR